MTRVSAVSVLVIKSQGKGYSKYQPDDVQHRLGRPLSPQCHCEFHFLPFWSRVISLNLLLLPQHPYQNRHKYVALERKSKPHRALESESSPLLFSSSSFSSVLSVPWRPPSLCLSPLPEDSLSFHLRGRTPVACCKQEMNNSGV